METDQKASRGAAAIIREAKRLANAGGVPWLIYVAAFIAGGISLDLMAASDLNDLLSVVYIVALYPLAYWALRVSIANGLHVPNGFAGGFWVYFGLSIVASIAIGIGFLLLLVPGLLLSIRWAPATGFVLVEGHGVTGSLKMAWSTTQGLFLPIALAMVIPLACQIGGLAFYTIVLSESDQISLADSATSNFMGAAGRTGMLLIGLAVYSLVRSQSERLSAVFD